LQCPTNGHHLPFTKRDKYSGNTQLSQPFAIQNAKYLTDSLSICLSDKSLLLQKWSNLQSKREREREEEEEETITQGVNSDWRVTIAVIVTTCQIYINSFEYSKQ
jgi:hypothetical protein